MSCDCNTLVIGEAGPQGPQGFNGIDGVNGTNGVNAFTTLTNSFTQPAVYPATGNSVTLAVADTSWMVVGQYVYIQSAGTYKVLAINSSISVNVYLALAEISVGSTVSANRRIGPGGPANTSLSNVNSLDINTAFTAQSAALRVYGSSTLALLQVDANLNKVGINTTPVVGGPTFALGGSLQVTGDSQFAGEILAPRFKTGNGGLYGQLSNILYKSETIANSTYAGSSVTKKTVTVTGATLGNMVLIGYTADPTSTFETDVIVTGVVSSADTVTVFFNNTSATPFTGAINLSVAVVKFEASV
jgi:hypothetical protein